MGTHLCDESGYEALVDLDKGAGEVHGLSLRQGDGFDQPHGIFVGDVDIGCAAETLGLHPGDEVLTVNGVDVTTSSLDCTPSALLVVPTNMLLTAPLMAQMCLQSSALSRLSS